MTTIKQITANRLNAQKSTGPRSRNGKLRARQNAILHGLTAETVITALESADEYTAFERAIAADYRPGSNVERILVVRLASLLWRLRRSVAIETGLFQAQGRMVQKQRIEKNIGRAKSLSHNHQDHLILSTNELSPPEEVAPTINGPAECEQTLQPTWQPSISECFFRLTTGHGDILERIERYKASLWRQAAQTITILDSCQKITHHESNR